MSSKESLCFLRVFESEDKKREQEGKKVEQKKRGEKKGDQKEQKNIEILMNL